MTDDEFNAAITAIAAAIRGEGPFPNTKNEEN